MSDISKFISYYLRYSVIAVFLMCSNSFFTGRKIAEEQDDENKLKRIYLRSHTCFTFLF